MPSRPLPSAVRIRRIATALALSASFALTFASTASARDPTKEELSSFLKQDEKRLQELTDTQVIAEREGETLKDRRGRTPKQDVHERVLTPEIRAQLQLLLSRARDDVAAGDIAEAKTASMSFHAGVTDQVELFNAIVNYWREFGRNDAGVRIDHTGTLQTNGIDVSERREANRLRDAFDQQIEKGEFAEAMKTTVPAMRKMQRSAVIAESEEIRARLESGALTPVLEMPVRARCVRATKSSGEAVPRLGPNFPSSAKYYPGGHGYGLVEVFAIISSEGCLKRMVVFATSGDRGFDQAALHLAQDGTYLPAEKDGVRVEGALLFRVEFGRQ